MGFDKGSSILGLLLADSKFSQLGKMTVLVTNLYNKGLNSWRDEELGSRITTMRRNNNESSLEKENKSQHHMAILFYMDGMSGS